MNRQTVKAWWWCAPPVLLVVATMLVFVATALRSSEAAGVGPGIALGTPSGNQVPVNAVTTATSPYTGFSLHIHADVGAGVNLTSIAESNVGTVISVAGDSSDVYCASAQAVPERLYGCVGFANQAITTGGLLATFTFNATGNGCIVVNLVHVPGDVTADTYTVDSNTSTAQSNIVSQTPVNVLIGSGTADDCAGVGTATPTSTSTPTSTPTLAATATPCAAECPTPTATNTPAGGYPPPTGNCVVAIKATAFVGEQTSISATVRDVTGAFLAGANVEFSIVLQPGADANVTADAAITDALGVVTGTVAVGSVPGVVQVQATAPTVSCGASIVVS